jgi:hypothetical protein
VSRAHIFLQFFPREQSLRHTFKVDLLSYFTPLQATSRACTGSPLLFFKNRGSKARKRVNPTLSRALVLRSRRPNVTSDFWSNPPVVASASSCDEQPPTAALAPVDATAYERSRRVDVQLFGSGGCRAAPARKAEHSAPNLNYFPSYTTVVSSADCRRRRRWYAPSLCSAEISASKHVHRVQHPVLHCARRTAESAIHYKHCG